MSTFSKSLKEKTSLDLAMAIVEAARDGRFDKDTVQLLDEIVVASTFPRSVIELRLLQQLAERARKVRGEDWNEEMAKKIWDTVVLAETVNNRPRTFTWLRGLLDQADALRHEAEIRLHPRALGFASERQIARLMGPGCPGLRVHRRLPDQDPGRSSGVCPGSCHAAGLPPFL